MSIQVRTATMTVTPKVNESSNGKTYFSTDVMEPVNYNVEFSGEGGHNPKHLEALYKKADEEGEALDITFIQKKGRFGTTLVIFDMKPFKPFTPMPKTA